MELYQNYNFLKKLLEVQGRLQTMRVKSDFFLMIRLVKSLMHLGFICVPKGKSRGSLTHHALEILHPHIPLIREAKFIYK